MSSKSSSPDTLFTSAVVLPPPNRLSTSLSSLTWMMEDTASLRSLEYFDMFLPSSVSELKRLHAPSSTSVLSRHRSLMVSSILFGLRWLIKACPSTST